MTAIIIDGRRLADAVIAEVGREAAGLAQRPGLALVLVAPDAASRFNADSKVKRALEIGFRPDVTVFPASAVEAEILGMIDTLNRRDDIDGILVQLPLPLGIDTARILAAVDPRKDVDGLNPLNLGLLAAGTAGFAPCTPLCCLKMIRSVCPDLAGRDAVVVGSSDYIAKPMAALLAAERTTVTLIDPAAADAQSICRGGDIVVSAADRPGLVRGSWIKPGAIVIDAGAVRVPKPGGGLRLVGDVVLDEALEVAGAVSPVPGGTGPMTIACILENTLLAARARRPA
jgi:methylenetetrahydrofolate dehydrogenase (NADP+)/methenyltetrahydrofolate cyclohydrolase